MVPYRKLANYPALGLVYHLVLIVGGTPGAVPVFGQKFHEVGFEVRRETPHVIAVFLVLGKTPECRLIVLEGLNPRRYVSSSFHVGVLVSLVSKCVFGSNCRM